MSGQEPWRLELASTALRDLSRLPEKIALTILEYLPAIEANPYRLGKLLHLDLEGQRAARRGAYRVLYRLEEEERVIVVVAIGHRSDVYRPR